MDWPLSGLFSDHNGRHWIDVQTDVDDHSRDELICPYGEPGDRLWVRETWTDLSYDVDDPMITYRVDDHGKGHDDLPPDVKWRPNIFMPRYASRIDLKITDVRLERIQDIDFDDCLAEGISRDGFWSDIYNDPENLEYAVLDEFKRLWDSINARPKPVHIRKDEGRKIVGHYESFPWEDAHEVRKHNELAWYVSGNPWVWVVEFERINP